MTSWNDLAFDSLRVITMCVDLMAALCFLLLCLSRHDIKPQHLLRETVESTGERILL
jgi:hypothetical protein